MRLNGIVGALPITGKGSVAFLALLGVTLGLPAERAEAQETITWFLPLQRAVESLQQRYGKPITYEDPVRRWRGELYVLGRDQAGGEALRVKEHTFVVPEELTPEKAAALDVGLVTKLVEAYHQQNPDQPSYGVLESRLGLHVVPVQGHDEQGRVVPVGSVLDARVSVPFASRTASEHVAALCRAVSEATGTTTLYSSGWFDQYFAANGYLLSNVLTGSERPYMLFEWGSSEATAREALINLMDRSSMTMTWILTCGRNGQAGNAVCRLNMLPLMVGTARMVVAHDRCTNCKPVPVK